MKIRIFTDGACSGNPGPGGWAAVILLPNELISISGSDHETTNNRMEVLAAIKAIKTALQFGQKLDIYSDSAYLVNAIELGWLKKWRANNWKTTRDEEVKNKDLWLVLLELITKNRKINFIKVKGHSGSKYNEMVDKLARNEVEKIKREG